MNLESLYLIATALCMVLGALMSLGAAIGLVRFPDLLTRLHAGLWEKRMNWSMSFWKRARCDLAIMVYG